MLPKEHYDAANKKDHRQKETTEDNQLPTTSPNKNLDPDLDANMSKLPGLRSRLRSRIYTTKYLLTEMTTPIQSPPQELVHEGYIKRINELTLEANTDLLDIEANNKNDIEAKELENFKASLYNIERETFAA